MSASNAPEFQTEYAVITVRSRSGVTLNLAAASETAAVAMARRELAPATMRKVSRSEDRTTVWHVFRDGEPTGGSVTMRDGVTRFTGEHPYALTFDRTTGALIAGIELAGGADSDDLAIWLATETGRAMVKAGADRLAWADPAKLDFDKPSVAANVNAGMLWDTVRVDTAFAADAMTSQIFHYGNFAVASYAPMRGSDHHVVHADGELAELTASGPDFDVVTVEGGEIIGQVHHDVTAGVVGEVIATITLDVDAATNIPVVRTVGTYVSAADAVNALAGEGREIAAQYRRDREVSHRREKLATARHTLARWEEGAPARDIEADVRSALYHARAAVTAFGAAGLDSERVNASDLLARLETAHAEITESLATPVEPKHDAHVADAIDHATRTWAERVIASYPASEPTPAPLADWERELSAAAESAPETDVPATPAPVRFTPAVPVRMNRAQRRAAAKRDRTRRRANARNACKH